MNWTKLLSNDGLNKIILIVFFGYLCSSLYSQQITAGYYYSYAQCPGGAVWNWGHNTSGQLSDGTTVNNSSPAQIINPSPIISIASFYEHSLMVKSDGTVWACGNGSYGKLGIGNTTNQLTFVQVNTITNAVAVSCGYGQSFAITGTGNVYAWGYNGTGELGDGTTTDRNSPVLLSSLSGIVAIEAAFYNTYALKNDGTVWGWGAGWFGSVGDGTTIQRNSPVQVVGLTDVIAISAMGNFCLALKSDGTVWAWGYNDSGQLGDGTTTNRTSPVQVQGLTGIVSISAGEDHGLAVKNDGTAWAWGSNSRFKLGDGTTTTRLLPIQITALAGSISSVSAGAQSSYAVKSDGTMWSWGWNIFGQLGDGTANSSATAVQIPIICAVPLPIELLNFSAICSNRSIMVNWSTASETNNDYFLLERSSDGINYTSIQTIGGAGNSSQELNYHIIDKNVLSNQIYYYRLSQTDFNGQKEYFDVISAQACADDNDITFVNPTNGLLVFQFSKPNLTASYTIFNSLGQLILSGEISNKENNIDINRFSNGLYHIQLKVGQKERTEKIILQH